MSGNLEPYPVYKDSRVSWLGELPSHWEVRRLRSVTEMRVSNVDKNSVDAEVPVRLCNYIDVYKNSRITATISFMHATATPQEIEHFRLHRDDVIITKDSEAWNDIGVPSWVQYSASDLVCGYHLAILRRREDVLSGRYLFWALQSQGVAGQLHVSANGVTRFGLSRGDIKSIVIPVPSIGEQATIARFLDYADWRIRRYILAKQKLIKLLGEQKQAIIHDAVTRGLDSNVPLKPSGVAWLQAMPEHWTITQLQRHWRIVDCKHVTVPFVDNGIALASVREVQSFDLSLANAKRTTDDWYSFLIDGDRCPKRGDLIYCRNVSVGACAYVNTDEMFAMGQDVCLIRSENQNQRYLNYLLHSPFMQQQLAQVLIGSTFNRINVSEVKSLIVLVPPREEQDAIAVHLDSVLAGAHAAIDRIDREINLIREYRTRLITDVVTGKLDVREAAADLPDEVEELDSLAFADATYGADDSEPPSDESAEEKMIV